MRNAAISRSTFLLGSLFLCGIIVCAQSGCGGIDEPDLFTGDAGSSSSGDSGKSDSATKDAGKSTFDSGVISTGNVIACADGPCAVGDNVCCEPTDGTSASTCGPPANCSGDNQLPIPCDDANDCAQLGHPGELCCATAGGNGSVTSVECRAVSDCRSDHGQTNLCDPTAAVPCTNGGTCTASTSLPGFYLCDM